MRRSAGKIMLQLIGLVKPLLGIMAMAVFLGTAGYLCAISLTVLGSDALVWILAGQGQAAGTTGVFGIENIRILFVLMAVLAAVRGLFHYAEQYCNHYIAFKLLARIRHQVFAALRRLCPAKLEGKNKGNLIAILTTDIELLEVFYAHTISPIAIAVLTEGILVVFLGQYHPGAAILAAAGYLLAGAVIPCVNSARNRETGMAFRSEFGELNSFVLESLRGLDETIQYRGGEKRARELNERSEKLGQRQGKLSSLEGTQRAVTNLVILLCSAAMACLMLFLYQRGQATLEAVVICTVTMMGSFGPVIALASLSNNLAQTLASGERILTLLEEEPVVQEVRGNGRNLEQFTGGRVQDVSFSYGEKPVLTQFHMELPPKKIVGIYGKSGCGKSTLLKLLMRFYDVNAGKILLSGEDIRQVETASLRQMEGYVTQTTFLFNDTIAANIGIAKENADREEIIEAAKKASIHERIMELPHGYDTKAGELGESLSDGEKQRIGLARDFLQDAPLLLLDEPTSNLDVLNEGMILKSLKEQCREKTVVLVSHRSSTMNIVDERIDFEGRV